MFKAPRGTADVLPPEQPLWRWVEKEAEELCHRYGYQRLDTPVFEEAGLFIRTIGAGTDIVEKEMYLFQDRGGKDLALRPEGTAAVCRAYLEHGMASLPQPVRLYYLFPLFRYERPQAGRYRQHHQWGAEAIGEADPLLDAEIIDLAWQFYAGLGLRGLSLHLNSLGCPQCRSTFRQALTAYYSAHLPSLCPDCQARFERNPLRLLDCKQSGCQQAAEAAPRSIEYLCPPCRGHFESLTRYLGLWEVPYELNHRLVRGLDYYTRTVFEVQPQEGGAQSTIGGGGRYDGLIEELGGRPTPGVGFATGIERIVLNLRRQGIAPPLLPGPPAYICYLEGYQEEALRLLARLRREGIGALAALSGRSLKAQLRQADALSIPYALLLGEEEVKSGTITVRDMRSGEQHHLPTPQIVPWLKAANREQLLDKPGQLS